MDNDLYNFYYSLFSFRRWMIAMSSAANYLIVRAIEKLTRITWGKAKIISPDNAITCGGPCRGECTQREHKSKSRISATSTWLSLFLSNKIFSPSVCSRQNKLWVDLLTDVSLTRKNKECLVPWLYWIMNYSEIPVSDMLIDVCQHCSSEKSFIKTKTRHTGQPWATFAGKRTERDVYVSSFWDMWGNDFFSVTSKREIKK